MERAWRFAGWYCRRGDSLSGPLRPEDIKKLVSRRRLRPADRIWEKWTRGRKSFLFPALATTASAVTTREQVSARGSRAGHRATRSSATSAARNAPR
jgi:hypothetical protein